MDLLLATNSQANQQVKGLHYLSTYITKMLYCITAFNTQDILSDLLSCLACQDRTTAWLDASIRWPECSRGHWERSVTIVMQHLPQIVNNQDQRGACTQPRHSWWSHSLNMFTVQARSYAVVAVMVLMCHPKQHMLAKLVHIMRVFRDEDTEWVSDLLLDRFESSENESCGDVSSDEYENELVEVDDISQFGFLEAP